MDSLFLDPIIRGPCYVCGLLGFMCGIVGIILIFRRQTLIGETLAHTSYPGIIIGAIGSEWFLGEAMQFWSVVGAVTVCLCAMKVLQLLERQKARSDAALSFLLSSSFAIGLLFISMAQPIYPILWKQMQMLLVGQAPAIRDEHVLVVASIVIVCCSALFFLARSLKTVLFDSEFAEFSSLTNRWIEVLIQIVVVITVVVSLRVMGIILMTSLLVFPGVSARLLFSSFRSVSIGAGLIGGSCGFVGVFLSEYCAAISGDATGRALWIPTGPLIAVVLICFFGMVLLLGPKQGLMVRLWRKRQFVHRCIGENILKLLWKECDFQKTNTITFVRLAEISTLSHGTVRLFARRLCRKGFLEIVDNHHVAMTEKGMQGGRKLVRLHRLWELYLVECCGVPKDRVHPSAEEMEHILTPSIEHELLMMLKHPLFDPHQQPIPEG